MKRCPKCSRIFPDENQKFCTVDGGLLTSETFDPNATVQGVSAPIPSGEPSRDKPAGKEPPDLNATVASSASAPTAVFPKQTGPSGMPTVAEWPTPPTASAPVPQAAAAPVVTAPPRKKSKLPLILGILLVLLVLGVGAVVAAFFLVINPRLKAMEPERPIVVQKTKDKNGNARNARPATEPEFVPPPNTVKFTNSSASLEGKLAEHYIDFSFYYPKTWAVDPKAGVAGASNFVKVERMLPPDFTQENFAVGWYTSKGTFEADEATFPQLVKILSANLSNGFPGYRKVSEGSTKVASLDGYEFRFVSISRGTEKGDIQVWGRVIFVPTGVSGAKTGATLIMLATSLAPELAGVDDVGAKGELPVILESFRFGRGS